MSGGVVPTIRASLLGPPIITVAGADLQVDTRKAIALFAVVLVEKSVRRDRIADLLWSDAPEERARAALRRTLSALSKGLGGVGVLADRERIEIFPDEVSSDVAELMDASSSSALPQRRGSFLEGLEVRGAAEFDAWKRETARGLDDRWLACLDEELRIASRRADRVEMEALATARLVVDPAHERTQALLIWLAAQAGDRDLVAARYRTCVATLHRELGIAPMARTTRLYEDALESLTSTGTWDPDEVLATELSHGEPTLGERVTAVVALAPNAMPLSVVAEAAGVRVDELAGALQPAGGEGLAIVDGDRVTIGPSARSRALSGLDLVERHALHRRLAAALDGHTDFAADRAQHLVNAGLPTDAAVAWEAAAAAAVRRGAWEEARSCLDRALALPHPDEGRLLVERADLDARRGRHEEARDGLMAALVLAHGDTERADREARLGRLQLRRQKWGAAIVHLRAAAALGAPVDAEVALATWHLGDPDAAVDTAGASLHMAMGDGRPDAVISLRNVLGVLLRRAGQLDVASEHLEAGLELASSADPARAALLNNLGLVRIDEKRWGDADVLLREACSVARDLGDLHREAAILNNLADVARATGDLDGARALVKESATRFALVSVGPVPSPELWSTRDW